MSYILRVIENNVVCECEYVNLRDALEYYDIEETATVSECYNGKEKVLIRKINGKECEV